MNTMEERLWSYIDGTCTEAERGAIEQLIAGDTAWRSKYDELMSFELQLSKMELDEPSMGFTYKVMETIRTDYAQQPLKATINPCIIRGIAAFFVFTILALVVFMFATVPAGHATVPGKLPVDLKLPQGFDLSIVKNYVSGSLLLKAFFVVDGILALFLADAWMRRKRQQKQALRP